MVIYSKRFAKGGKNKLSKTYIIPGCLLLGLGVGMAINQAGPGLLIGLGAGFILNVIVSMIIENESKLYEMEDLNKRIEKLENEKK